MPRDADGALPPTRRQIAGLPASLAREGGAPASPFLTVDPCVSRRDDAPEMPARAQTRIGTAVLGGLLVGCVIGTLNPPIRLRPFDAAAISVRATALPTLDGAEVHLFLTNALADRFVRLNSLDVIFEDSAGQVFVRGHRQDPQRLPFSAARRYPFGEAIDPGKTVDVDMRLKMPAGPHRLHFELVADSLGVIPAEIAFETPPHPR